MTSAQLINQTSGKTEYYTPKFIIEAARTAMGGIDLDPASSEQANKRVQATLYFDEARDGLLPYWGTPNTPSRVWMNHPFGRESNPLWIKKLFEEYASGRVRQACCITFACTSEKWFQPLLKMPQCFLCPRTNYVLPDGSILRGVTKGSVVTYLGAQKDRFVRAFEELGPVKITA